MQIQKTTVFNPIASARSTVQKRSLAVGDLGGEKKEVDPVQAIKKASKNQSGIQGYLTHQDQLDPFPIGDQKIIDGESSNLFTASVDPKFQRALDAYLSHQSFPYQERRIQLQRLLGVDAYV